MCGEERPTGAQSHAERRVRLDAGAASPGLGGAVCQWHTPSADRAVAPGFIESDMTEVLSDKVKDAMKGQIPMKRFGMPEEIATATQFLAEQEYTTGQVLTIDGGVSM